jgi:hypothetical protein
MTTAKRASTTTNEINTLVNFLSISHSPSFLFGVRQLVVANETASRFAPEF